MFEIIEGFSGKCEQADLDAIEQNREQEEPHVKHVTLSVSQQDEGATLIINTKLKSGLELKPRRIPLITNSDVNLISVLTALILQNRTLTSEAAKTASELQLTQKTLDTVISDKEEYQGLVLKRVAAMLTERNFWIEKFQQMKPESDV